MEKNKVLASTKVRNAAVKAATVAGMLAMAIASNPAVLAADKKMEGTETMIDLVTAILPYVAIIGIPMALVGGFKLIMAFRNDQGDAVPAAARDLAIGIAITFISVFGDNILTALK
ncbi:MAG: hypothetical protein IKM88_15155 [Lachnospiraceae bacterium]|nr:hypothetical protein [Lachnospiraceae bacterium]MBR3735700.1 hypothetical protein [Lachnospiraceae bacterium]MBR6851561.1 hypothetical protein [Lachnospiraceae bacterium]